MGWWTRKQLSGCLPDDVLSRVRIQSRRCGQACDVSDRPSVRVERHRGLGVCLLLFATPFCAALIVGLAAAVSAGEIVFAIAAGLLLLIPTGLVAWGLHSLLTVTTLVIGEDDVRHWVTTPWGRWGNDGWQQPLSTFRLQLRQLTLRGTSDPETNTLGRLRRSFVICLVTEQERRTVELSDTASRETAFAQLADYRDALGVRLETRIEDYNTGRTLDSLPPSLV